jgi:DUF1009 family protein
MTPELGSESAPAAAGGPLVILAAGGAVPFQVASAATAAGRQVLVIALEGAADERLRAFTQATVKWGQIGKVEALIERHGGREICLIGAVDRRPDFANIGVDLGALRYLPRIIKGMIGGDDTVLGNLVKGLEERGFRVVGAHEVAPMLVAAEGRVAGPDMGASERGDALLAMTAARAVGALDIGQAAVAVGMRVIALEAAEGTDAMLERVAALRANGRAKWSGRAGVLAKRSKPQQDLRVDMPAIGPKTVEAVMRAGLAGIAIEPGRVMIAERAETVALASRTGTFIVAYGDLPAPVAG